MFIRKSLVAIASLSLFACGNDDGGGTSIVGPAESVPELNSMTMPLSSLTSAPSNEFERHLKNGIYLRNQSEFRVTFGDVPESVASADMSFSGTNVQEQGVDEGDRIKYDGEFLFIANNQAGDVSILEEDRGQPLTSIRIMQRQSQGEMLELNTVTVNEEASSINGMYLNENTLAVLSDIYQYNIAAASFDEMFFPVNSSFNLSLVDVTSKQAPQVNLSFTIEGSVVDSRRIDNMLYIVSSYRPWLEDVVYADTEQGKLDNYNKIMQTDIAELLPHYTDADGNNFNLVNAENCYLPETATERDGFDGVITLTAINLAQPTEINSICVNAEVQGLYASQQSLYLYGTEYQYLEGKSSETSVVHKFNFNANTIDYRASGTLDGRFNWSLSNLRFSERGDYLRVVTTTGDSVIGLTHRLNVLAEDGNKLSLVSQLPNDINPQLLGKVSNDGKVYEDIQAVRFFDDQAYVVTFLKSDPLYVIDLEDNLNPVIAGELEIPGYSAYLHPISENLLLGVGQNVQAGKIQTLEGDVDTASSDDFAPIVEGAKVSLFDVSDISAPKEIHSIVYQDAYTPVEFDYHALSYLTNSDGSTRFAIPIERWLTETRVDSEQQKYDVWYRENELAVVEVTSQQTIAELQEIGRIKASFDDETQNTSSGWQDRSIFHQDDIYYIHGAQIWHSQWSDLTQVLGPY
ncbi:hypothetical protein tinsulaeT_08210 [Thalassotalea insulae]|uniref:Beta-propeller domain-containing protein n=1 Tax=Thalassotalea insulae TaxID=2056778 RepID=A0ABQ6GTJ4_9GAMM|nr:beta-propeller domain-containing protein [Thalassotalea insulae]GLX77481.1 hypothetical protein tinsulaeT_08210 [Thalassotalea insulae]